MGAICVIAHIDRGTKCCHEYVSGGMNLGLEASYVDKKGKNKKLPIIKKMSS